MEPKSLAPSLLLTSFSIFSLFFILSLASAVAAPNVTPGKGRGIPLGSGPPSKTMGDANGNYTGQSRGNGRVGLLSPEQQAMLAKDPGGKAELQKLSTMSQNDSIKLKDRLQKEWDALPQTERDKVQSQISGKMTQQNSGLR